MVPTVKSLYYLFSKVSCYVKAFKSYENLNNFALEVFVNFHPKTLFFHSFSVPRFMIHTIYQKQKLQSENVQTSTLAIMLKFLGSPFKGYS